jgi:hypothetical protein
MQRQALLGIDDLAPIEADQGVSARGPCSARLDDGVVATGRIAVDAAALVRMHWR